ncbi:MAG: hypothetical protein CMH70_06065 [Nitrosomonadaceae bacterium]|nr:hypothetical protein [Nitrosomonadaceae bacterium]|tara:strand:- start:169 stop:585 length:417 start_codon:yes stop_codon:yes gene_type:complete
MFNKIIFIIFLLLFSNIIIAEPAIQSAQKLHSGEGWRVVRSVELGKTGKYVHMVLVDLNRDTDIAVYGAARIKICRNESEFCRIRFWNEERYIPNSLSFTKNQYKALRAEYTFNREGGIQQMRYACTVLPNKSLCFKN